MSTVHHTSDQTSHHPLQLPRNLEAVATERVSKTEIVLLTLILAVAALLRFYQIGSSSLWSDEGNTWALLSRSFAQIAQDAAADIHPPGYYWLLKLWSIPFGTSATAMRSFSAILGILLVYLVYRIGRRLSTRHSLWLALPAALLAAINPLQIYYSQEARMYLLLAVAGAGLMVALFCFLEKSATKQSTTTALFGYVLAGMLGLWTHYSFPMILVAAGLGYVFEQRRSLPVAMRLHAFLRFALANGLVLLLYLPWLATAIERVLTWPAGGNPSSLFMGIELTAATFLVGPRLAMPAPQWPWLWLSLLLPLGGFWAGQNKQGSILLLLWWILPIGLMFGLGLFSDAFLKFLLTASPAWVLLLAMVPWLLPWPRPATLLLVAGALTLAVTVLPHYYGNPTVRDNYAGVAAYIAATADPAHDLVILDAPGQQEVWHYYDPGIPVLPLPEQRPADALATIATLTEATVDRRNVYALFWATDEADPERIVEHYLDAHSFKGWERWQGHLRFVLYTFASEMDCVAPTATGDLQWGGQIALTALCRPATEQVITAGESALLGLHWQAQEAIATRYKVSVQLLNERNLVIEQHDSEPVGGSRPTDTWQPNEIIVDNHGVLLPIGTPPGIYRMIVAVYDPTTGTRLPIMDQSGSVDSDYLTVGTVQVVLPAQPLPAELSPVQHAVNRAIGPLCLVGYSAYRQGFVHAPQTALSIGDPVEFTFVWQAPVPLPAQWPDTMAVALNLGNETVTFAPAGDGYPTAAWQAGQLVRYTVVIPYDGTTNRPLLQYGQQTIRLAPLPVQQ